MRLADSILNNVEPILAEWESFARSIWPSPPPRDGSRSVTTPKAFSAPLLPT
jgi:hypothetical protein